ncbi:arsenate reductase/protein-tyrosine-phosphatase family protein [Saccharopolyspora aridisoli]
MIAAASIPHPAPDRFSILFVCTGNICRSPFAEYLARSVIDQQLGANCGKIVISSAGTHALQGSAMDPHVEAELRGMGLDGDGFTAKRLTTSHLQDADLVLTAELPHRAAVVEQHAPALRTTFSMLEFAHLLASTDLSGHALPADPVQRAREVVRIGRNRRGVVRPARHREIPDPFRKGAETHRLVTALITYAVRNAVSALWSVDSSSSPSTAGR